MSPAARWIQPLEEDIVNRVVASLGYLSQGSGGTCKAIGNVQTFLQLAQIAPPFVLVKYDGEISARPTVMGRTAMHQTSEFGWMLFVGAQSFSAEGEGRTDNVGGNRGIYSMLDDLYFALEGYLLPSAGSGDKNFTKMFHKANTPPGVESHRVTAISTWYCSVVRLGDANVNLV